MAFLQWRRFTFFEREEVRASSDNELDKLKEVEVTCCASGKGQIVCGDADGRVHFIGHTLDIFSFRAHGIRVRHVNQPRQNAVLVTVGEDEPGINPLIKVWNIDKYDRQGDPLCTRIVRAIPPPPNNRPAQVTALAVHENLTQMAIGFEDGSVVLFKGDITRDRHCKSRLIHGGMHEVTALVFRTTPKHSHLFVVTTSDVFSYNLSAKEKEQKCHLDEFGCPSRCATVTDQKHDSQLVVARREAVYFYEPDDRGQCLGFEGDKLLVHWFRGYFVIVGPEQSGVNDGQKQQPKASSSTSSSPVVERNRITIYDVQNKFIAYCAPIPEVIDIVSEWGSLYVLCKNNKLFRLLETDTQSKLATLFKKNLYVMAIQLAKSQQYDEDGLVDIFRQYGDHLYAKGDHDAAVSQYVKTIGKLEASYVIRKFLDAQRIHNLTAYLQALHKRGLATEDHTTLLLNCYTKLKDIDKLDEFIMTRDREVDFDVEIAIRVCRSAGYFQHALYLAETHAQHGAHLRILLEDLCEFKRALDHIGRLPFAEAEANMKKYGKILMSEIPVETTEFLKRLCTDYMPSDEPIVDVATLDGSRGNIRSPEFAAAEEYIHIFVNNSAKLTEFLEHMIRVQPNLKSAVYNTLLEVYIREYQQKKDSEPEQKACVKKTLDLLQQQNAGYDLGQALVLCQVNKFSPGILLLYEKAKLFQQILQYHMENEDYPNVVLTCKKFGSMDPSLWIRALRYFVEEGCRQENNGEYLGEVLQAVEKKNLLPPLMVINMMAASGSVTLGSIKKYMIQQLQQENDRIADDERLIAQYKDETQKMRHQIDELKTSARIFQVSKCCTCNNALELPSVHFLCQHSYHQQCFESYSENESECIVCIPENKKVLDIVRSQEHSTDLHEQFHHQLERSNDGFSVVAEYFGRGIFANAFPAAPLPPSSSSFSSQDNTAATAIGELPKQKVLTGLTKLNLDVTSKSSR